MCKIQREKNDPKFKSIKCAHTTIYNMSDKQQIMAVRHLYRWVLHSTEFDQMKHCQNATRKIKTAAQLVEILISRKKIMKRWTFDWYFSVCVCVYSCLLYGCSENICINLHVISKISIIRSISRMNSNYITLSKDLLIVAAVEKNHNPNQ